MNSILSLAICNGMEENGVITNTHRVGGDFSLGIHQKGVQMNVDGPEI